MKLCYSYKDIKKFNKKLTHLGFESFLIQVSSLKTKRNNEFNIFKANLLVIAQYYTNKV